MQLTRSIHFGRPYSLLHDPKKEGNHYLFHLCSLVEALWARNGIVYYRSWTPLHCCMELHKGNYEQEGPALLPRTDQVQPWYTGIGHQEFLGLTLICLYVLCLCNMFYFLICSIEFQKIPCSACFTNLFSALCVHSYVRWWHVLESGGLNMSQVLWPPEFPLTSITTSSPFKVFIISTRGGHTICPYEFED